MAVRTIDGTIEEVELKNRRKLGSVYSRVLFRLPDGRREEVGKAVVWNNVADHLKPGTKGRFYLYNAIDHRGIHGVRAAGSIEAYGFGKQNEIVAIIVLAMAALTFWLNAGQPREHFLDDIIWLVTLILLIGGGPMYFAYRHTRLQAERQFREDSGYRAPAG